VKESIYYILYGVDNSDDYIKVLSKEEFGNFKEVIDKFISTDNSSSLWNPFNEDRVNKLKNNILYYMQEIIQKGELKINTDKIIIDDGVHIESSYSADTIIPALVERFELIKKANLEFINKFRILNVDIYIFKLEII